MRIAAASALLTAFALTGCAGPEGSGSPARPVVAFLSDFGSVDDSVALCKGEMLKAATRADLRIVDVTHNVTPFDVAEAARYLAGAAPHFPAGTVFVCVVDPGVGGQRLPIALRTKAGQFYVGPDNGLVTLLEQRDGIAEVRRIANTDWMAGGKLSSTFHGRDIFAPVGAHVAARQDQTAVGPALDPAQLVRLKISLPKADDAGLVGEVIALDGPYGNLVTNVSAEEFRTLGWKLGDTVAVRIGGREFAVPFVRTFSEVAEGKPLLYEDSRGRVALAINQGNFAKANGIAPPTELRLPRKR
jgi:S-adenosylmethionine hydrolase